ncbi:MAG: aminotransferase class I/II-fold pyridoxal phosphate-dependent enzyme [Nitrososphaerales archaeon]
MDELENLRRQIREVTAEIMKYAKKRMEIAKEIGEIKNKRSLDIVDEKTEDELRKSIVQLCTQIDLEPDVGIRLLNVLLNESERVQLKRKTPTTVFTKAKQLEKEGKKIIHLEVGEPDFVPPAAVKDALTDAIEKGHYHYTEPRGVPELREALARSLNKKFNSSVREEQVIVTVGGRFAVFLAISSVINPGDEIVVVEPDWPAYRDCAELVNAKLRVLHTTLEDKWVPDLGKLEKIVNKNTRMMIINSPNNPTGKVLDEQILEKIVTIAKDNKLILMSDEVYADYSFNKFTSILDYNYDSSITISSFSKGPAMTGFRVGYAVANTDIISRMGKLQAVALTSVAEPMQYAALNALENNNVKENAKAMKRRLSLISNRLKKMPVSFVEPEGAMYVFARVDLDRFNADQFTEKALDQGLALTPGSAFGNYPNFLRISAGRHEDMIEEGLDILQRSLHYEHYN